MAGAPIGSFNGIGSGYAAPTGTVNPGAIGATSGQDLNQVPYGSSLVNGLAISAGSSFNINTAAPDGIINWNKSAYSQVTKSIKAMLAGGPNVRAMVLADSIHTAYINGTVTTSMRQNSPSGQAAKLLTANGIPAGIESQWGLNPDYFTNGNVISFAASDSRIILTGTWDNGIPPTVGFGELHTNNTSTTPVASIQFTPTSATDSIDVYYLDNGYNPFIITDGARNVLATCVPTAASYVKKLTAKIPGGAKVGNSFIINQNSASLPGTPSIYICGFEAYNSATPQISIINLAMGGSVAESGTAGYLYGSATNWYNTYPILTNATNAAAQAAPDIIFAAYGLNEIGLAVPVATYQAAIDDLCLKALSFGNKSIPVVLLTPPPSQIQGNFTFANQLAFNQATQTVLTKYGLSGIDVWSGFGRTWTNSGTNGYNSGDALHESQAGATEIGRFIATFLTLISA